jgi:hypothetical protein
MVLSQYPIWFYTARAIVMQQKTQGAVQFEIMEQTRDSVAHMDPSLEIALKGIIAGPPA